MPGDWGHADDAVSNVQHNPPNISTHGRETTAEQPESNTEHQWMCPKGEYSIDHQPGHEGPNWEEGEDVEIPDSAGPEDEAHNVHNQTMNHQPTQAQGSHRTWQQPTQVQGRHRMG